MQSQGLCVWHIKYLVFNRWEFGIRKGFIYWNDTTKEDGSSLVFSNPSYEHPKFQSFIYPGKERGQSKRWDPGEEQEITSLCSHSLTPEVSALAELLQSISVSVEVQAGIKGEPGSKAFHLVTSGWARFSYTKGKKQGPWDFSISRI